MIHITLAQLILSASIALQPSGSPQSAGGSAPTAAPAAAAITTKKLPNLTYATPAGSDPLLLDLYLPAPSPVPGGPDKPDKPVPVIVWIHGGGWSMGDKEWCPAALMVPQGYAAASLNYRLTQVAPFPAQIYDCKAAIRWLRAHAKEYNLDADHIGVWGASAGGHLVALLGTTNGDKELEGDLGNADQSSNVQCVLDWFGPTDLRYIAAPGANSEGVNGMVAALVGGTGDLVAHNAALASPMTHVSKDAVPFLIMHGDQDTLVSVNQSRKLQDALTQAGVESTLTVIPGAGHGGNQFGEAEIAKQINEFFGKHLKPAR